MKVLMMVVAGLLVCGSASAQVTLPGSMWSTNGTISPVEQGNMISLTHAEQGMSMRGAEVFVTTTVGMDSKGYDWNNKTQYGMGLRLTQTIGSGMVRVGVAYLEERRWISDRKDTGTTYFVDCWFQWGRR
jgi:hypothetical protein